MTATIACVLLGTLGVGYGCGARSDLGVLVGDPLQDGGQETEWAGHLDGAAIDASQLPQPDAGAIPIVHAGSYHYCARLPDASVKCWGSNDSAQLGDGTKIDRENAVSVLGAPKGVVDVRGGETNSCTLDAEGGVACWGQNVVQKYPDPFTLMVPTHLPLALPAKNLAVGWLYGCTVLSDNTPWCWGSCNGAVGTSCQGVTPPTPIAGVHQAQVVTTSHQHTCAIVMDGSVVCWGKDAQGQLGNGIATNDNLGPTTVVGLGARAISVALGFNFTCALLEGGTVKCWGDPFRGALGTGPKGYLTALTPTAAVGIKEPAVALDANGDFACVVLRSGGVECWGFGDRPDPSNGGVDPMEHDTALPVVGIGDAVAITLAQVSACVTRMNGHVSCWGRVIGANGWESRWTPKDVLGIPWSHVLFQQSTRGQRVTPGCKRWLQALQRCSIDLIPMLNHPKISLNQHRPYHPPLL